ncbi:hypothetical protein TEA_023357 [Camellia sinensis var. sinensis]|uniref:Translocon-associated protein subunit beta n=1 Tax=Camellia sinensis var. sinensis TaxID=542762 RepID=A0A4S4E6P8_CAMSN|nr:hypothetical protein TEA_023357 [Camellia sinensis var. sinensis]
MATQIAKCLVSVLIAALFLTLASSNAPFIVAHKKATLTRLKSGVECVSTSIDIYNQGSAYAIPPFPFSLVFFDLYEIISRSTQPFLLTAYDVSITDDSWSKDVFHIISGNTSMSWERLDVGALVSHAFELESEVLQALFYGAPVVITFRIPQRLLYRFGILAISFEAYSTPILPLDILTDRPPVKKFEWRLLAKYGSLISMIFIMASFVYLVATPSKSNATKGGKKK